MLRRGQVWWADVGDPRGSNPAYRRPVLIVQADLLNEVSALHTVIVVTLTSNTRHARFKGNVLLSAEVSGLARDSVVTVTSVATISRSHLEELVSDLPPEALLDVDAGLRLVMDLESW